MKQPQNDNPLISVARIRREFFAGPDAPTKREIASWIERGTAEGARLPGVALGGRYFCRRRDVENFLAASVVEPRRDVLYSPHTKRIFVPRLGERSALDVAKRVPTLAAAVDRAKEIAWSGDFEPVAGGWS